MTFSRTKHKLSHLWDKLSFGRTIYGMTNTALKRTFPLIMCS